MYKEMQSQLELHSRHCGVYSTEIKMIVFIIHRNRFPPLTLFFLKNTFDSN